MTNDSNIDFQMNSTHNHLQKILFPITAGIILEKCFITVVLYRQVLWGVQCTPIYIKQEKRIWKKNQSSGKNNSF